MTFPTDTWATAQPNDEGVLRVMVQGNQHVGFNFVTETPRGTFDVWLETKDEVEQALSELGVVWTEGM